MSRWLRQVEELKLASLDRGTRVLAITSPLVGAQSSELARMLADASHRAGQRTLLVDLAQGPDPNPCAPLWRGHMVLFEEAGLPSELSIRALRKSLQATLSRLRLTRDLVDGIALAASDLSAHILEAARPQRIGLRIALVDTALKLEIMHEGAPMAGIAEQLVASPQIEVISPGDRHLPFALARRSLPHWSYSEGRLNRLVGWCPIDGGAAPVDPPVEDREHCEKLIGNPSGKGRASFNNVEQMRLLLNDELADYQAIILDLPPILDDQPNRINPLATMAAADGAYLVCLAGKVDRASISRTRSLLQQSGVSMLGVVVNDSENPTLGAELAREARRLRGILPALSRWLERKALASNMLN